MAPPEAGIGRERPSVAASLASRHGAIVLACLIGLAALSWWSLVRIAAMPDGAMDPGMMDGMAMPPPAIDMPYLSTAFVMWAIMMVAMMLPSAAPMILLQDVFVRRQGLDARATGAFAFAYLALWMAFSFLAAGLQAALVGLGLVDSMTLTIGSKPILVTLLALAGLYEFSPLKRRCLAQCQAPAAFLVRYWRPGVRGALVMGLRHGAFCIGCCAATMLLLFAGGVMNLAWVGLLAIVILAEKLSPPAWRADLAIGASLLAGAGIVALS